MLPRFLAALLTGNGELARYTSPSSPIATGHPPPFTDGEVLGTGFAEAPDGFTVYAMNAHRQFSTLALLKHWALNPGKRRQTSVP